jgi:hypothetical protein
MYNMTLYYCVLIVFSLHRKSLKLILTTDLCRGGSVTKESPIMGKSMHDLGNNLHRLHSTSTHYY